MDFYKQTGGVDKVIFVGSVDVGKKVQVGIVCVAECVAVRVAV